VAGSDSLHRIELGSEAFDVEANAADIVMPADALDTKKLDRVIDRKPYVLVTVLSVGKDGFETETITCHQYVGTIKQAQTVPPDIHCGINGSPD